MYSGSFARYYDALTANVNYPARARYFHRLIKKYTGRKPRILLDLACGTGSLSWEFSAMGYEVVGVDASPEMLSAALSKAGEFPGVNLPLFLCQRMEELDLYGSVEACVCALDSLNHLPDLPALRAVFSRVALFLAPGGVFLFDVNTRHKHRDILGNNAFVYQTQGVICTWRNAYHERHGRVDISLDFFTPQGGGLYRRTAEQFSERIFSHRQLHGALKASGLDLLAVRDENRLRLPGKPPQRLVYAAKKRGQTASAQREK